mgnify:CR=1 FL=1|jgi:hypothetical protein
MEKENLYVKFENAIAKYLGERMKTDDELCSNVWSSLANVDWYYILDEKDFGAVSYSWRAAGGLISNIIDRGSYMDWYMSGPDAVVNEEFRRVMKKAGFIPDDRPMICDEPNCLEYVTCGWPDPSGGPYRCTCSNHYKHV